MLDVQKVKIAGLNSQLVVIKSEFKTLMKQNRIASPLWARARYRCISIGFERFGNHSCQRFARHMGNGSAAVLDQMRASTQPDSCKGTQPESHKGYRQCCSSARCQSPK
jgi:hypothetical protein